jgi:leucyl aminopeptidase
MSLKLKAHDNSHHAECDVIFISSKPTLTELPNKKPSKDTNAGKARLATEKVEPKFKEIIERALEQKLFHGKQSEIFFLRANPAEAGQHHVLFVGLGEDKKLTMENVRRASAAAVKSLRNQKVEKAAFHLGAVPGIDKNGKAIAQAATEGSLLANYHFDDLKSKKDEQRKPSEISLVAPKKPIERAFEQGAVAGEIIAKAVNFSRWLGDQPGNLMTPTVLAESIQKEAKGTSLKIAIWDKARIKKEKMGLLYGVSMGSVEEPRFIIMEYKGAAASKAPLCFVGKGLTFDAGGISIKPSAGMEEMKYDMCGGANVAGTMLAIARLGLKVNVIGIVPSSENLCGPAATKPGDIHTSRNGKTVEINNTDAEGRLILADALVYACEQKPAFICDIATLTGAMKMALGDTHTGFFSRDEVLTEQIEDAAKVSGEWVWEMPMCDDHLKDMKGTYADLNNISGPSTGAGSAKGAVFLGEFVTKGIPWAHFDIAGTAWHTGNRINYNPDRGANGVMIRTFVELAKSF